MVRYSVVKVDRIEEFHPRKHFYARKYIFKETLPNEIIALYDCAGHYEITGINFYKTHKSIEVHHAWKCFHDIHKLKYLIIEHEVNYEVTPETYWNELGSLEKPTITQIKCYQFIINNLI